MIFEQAGRYHWKSVKKNKRLLPGHTKKNVSEGVFICAKYESESGKHKDAG